jgi:hypothetical protein
MHVAAIGFARQIDPKMTLHLFKYNNNSVMHQSQAGNVCSNNGNLAARLDTWHTFLP